VRLLQRYILGELLRVFIFLLTVLMVLLVFVGVFQQAQENGLGPYQIIQILPYIIPSMLPYTIPAALLLTVSIVYGRISGDLEVTAANNVSRHQSHTSPFANPTLSSLCTRSVPG
jgi:lipopolysaccharide export system permease protein